MGKQLDIITHNPYRCLGVYSNSPTKERVANQGKMNAFLKVGKPVSFPLDLPNLLSPIERTEESVADAVSKLTLPADQLKYAQFWWMKVTDIDNIAFNHLMSGNTDVAKSVWEKKDNASSLQNRIVLALIQQDYTTAISCAGILYRDYTSSFVKAFTEISKVIGSEKLAYSFLDALMEEGLDIQELLSHITDGEWKAYVAEKAITPLIDSITQAIATAQASKGKGSEARYKAGQKLMTSTKSALSKLKSLLSTTDIRYTTTADKLGEEILQCGIDYFNDSDDDSSAYGAQELQQYASSIVVGFIARQRCEKNGETFKKIISELPPSEVRTEYRKVMEELRGFWNKPEKIVHAMSLLNNARPHLQAMKTQLDANNEHYLKLSTRIVLNALNNVISEVNDAQKDDNQFGILKRQHHEPRDLKPKLEEAWEAVKLMDKFDMEEEFRNKRYKFNRSTLRDMCKRRGISTATTWFENFCEIFNMEPDAFIFGLKIYGGIVSVFGLIGACTSGREGPLAGFFYGVLVGTALLIIGAFYNFISRIRN